jgi:MSHA biogenesis protein MshJ
MKQAWARWARRIDAMSLRERVMLFVSIAAALVAVADLLVIGPALRLQQRLAGEAEQRTQQLQALRTRVAAAGRDEADSAAGRMRRTLQALRDETAALEREIAAARTRDDEAARLAQLLERALRRHERLTLVRLDHRRPPASAGADTAEPPLHAVQLDVAGSYHDLARYLAELEATLPGLRVPEGRVTRDGQQTVLALRALLPGDRP